MFNTIFPKIHKEGYKFLAISILATFIVLFFSKFFGFILTLIIIISLLLFYIKNENEKVFRPINKESLKNNL